jgi:hypothetical protein
MTDVGREPRAVLPFLQPFYDVVAPLAWPLVRIAVGWNFIVHGYGKILRGMEKQAELLAHDGLNWGTPFAQFLTGRARRRHLYLARPVYALLGRGLRHRARLYHLRDVLGPRLFVAQSRLRIHADVGADLLCHRLARWRALFARPGAGAGVVERIV